MYVAIGMDAIVWGLGATEEAARADALHWQAYACCECGVGRVAPISTERAAAFDAGETDGSEWGL